MNISNIKIFMINDDYLLYSSSFSRRQYFLASSNSLLRLITTDSASLSCLMSLTVL